MLALLPTVALAAGSRIKDLAVIAGARDNQLVGYGLVIGLANDGDKNPVYTVQSIANMLQRFGITVPPATLSSKNVAAVMVTTDIPAFVKNGTRLDVTVSALGDAKTLQGGVLMQTPLLGADGKVYAVAQGALAVGGFIGGTSGPGGATVQKNHPTVAQIVGGALVEKEIPTVIVRTGSWPSPPKAPLSRFPGASGEGGVGGEGQRSFVALSPQGPPLPRRAGIRGEEGLGGEGHNHYLELLLREPDFTSAARMAAAINLVFADSAQALDSTSVRVRLPNGHEDAPVDFIARVEGIEVSPDIPARIVINERTGTIVATSRIRLSACAVSHGDLTITVASSLDVSQPNALSQTGTTTVTPRTDTKVDESKSAIVVLPEMPTIEKVASGLNAIGVSPRDMMAIFQAMKQAGALQAELLLR